MIDHASGERLVATNLLLQLDTRSAQLTIAPPTSVYITDGVPMDFDDTSLRQ